MAVRNVIQTELDAFAKRIGMEKQSGIWYRTTGEIIQALNLQKSQYGPLYYINIGLWLQALGPAKFPREQTWHVTIRLDTLLADRAEDYGSILDLRSDLADSERALRLKDLLNSTLLPLLQESSSIDGMRQLKKEGRLKSAAVRGAAASVLDSHDHESS
jgi:Domain of unknown function (DUF4304)